MDEIREPRAVGGPAGAALALPGATLSARARGYAFAAAAAALAGAAILALDRPPWLSTRQVGLALGVIGLGLLPTLVYLLAGAREPIPLLPLHGLFYALTFGLPLFSPELDREGLSGPDLDLALLLTAVGLVLLYLAYYGPGKILFARVRPIRLRARVPASRLRAIGWGFYLAHLAYRLLPALRSVPSLDQFLDPLGWLGLGLLYLLLSTRRLPLFSSAVFLGAALPFEIVSRFASGSLYLVLLLGLFLALVRWRVRRRLPWAAICAVLALFLFFNPVKHAYREKAWFGKEAAAGPFAKASMFVDLAIRYHFGGEVPEVSAVGSAANRVAHVATFARVIERTSEDRVPYWRGASYLPLATALVPRILWPGKPGTSLGNEFGHRYGFLAPEDTQTSFNLPWLPELYANFGIPGVLLGMACLGIALRFVVAKTSNPRASEIEHLLGLVLVFQLFYAESNLALMWSGLVLTFLSLYATLYLLTRRVRW